VTPLRWLWLASLFVVALPLSATAHPLRPGVLVVEELADGRVTAALRASIPANGAEEALSLHPTFSAPCTPLTGPTREGDLSRLELGGCPAGLGGTTVEVRGLEQAPDEEVLVRVHLADGRVVHQVLHSRALTLTIPTEPSSLDTLTAYLGIGALHFALGLDHVAFLVGLVLLVCAPPRRPDPTDDVTPATGTTGARATRLRLIGALSAFTLAHAITLGLASLGWLSLPQSPVEATIALSITLLGVELARRSRDPRTSLAQRAPATIAFAIGLVHGLGFAGALAETGLPRDALALGLLSFHVGLELAQLAFVALTLGGLTWIARLRAPRWRRWAELAPAYALGTLGTYWLIDRTVSMFG
jgi:hypothetical protein